MTTSFSPCHSMTPQPRYSSHSFPLCWLQLCRLLWLTEKSTLETFLREEKLTFLIVIQLITVDMGINSWRAWRVDTKLIVRQSKLIFNDRFLIRIAFRLGVAFRCRVYIIKFGIAFMESRDVWWSMWRGHCWLRKPGVLCALVSIYFMSCILLKHIFKVRLYEKL